MYIKLRRLGRKKNQENLNANYDQIYQTSTRLSFPLLLLHDGLTRLSITI